MANLCVRFLVGGIKLQSLRAPLLQMVKQQQMHYAKVASPEDYGDFTDPMELPEDSVQRRHLQATLARDDRYETKVYYKLENSSPTNPNLVPSNMDYRNVACFCEPDSTCPAVFVVHEGDPQRCRCGHWFKLVDAGGADFV